MRKHSLFFVTVLLLLTLLITQMTDNVTVAGDDTSTPSPTPLPPRDLDLWPTFVEVSTAEYEDCNLPCWWGFRLGKTTLDEIQTFLEETSFDRQYRQSDYVDYFPLDQYMRYGEPFGFDFAGGYCQDCHNFLITFGFDDNDILKYMTIRFNNPNRWLPRELNRVGLSQFLSQLEEIPEIYVPSDEYLSRFHTALSEYPIFIKDKSKKIEVSYHFNLIQNQSRDMVFQNMCLGIEQISRGVFLELGLLDNDEEPPNSDSFPPLEQALDISTEDFVQFFIENPDECLDLSEYSSSKGD